MSERRVSDATELVSAFERQRPYVRMVAVRMLGTDDDADDAIQETWLRLNRTGADGIEDLRAWLTTVTSRVCLDMLKTRRTRREVPVEIDLDDLLAGGGPTGGGRTGGGRTGGGRTPTPEDELLLAESVGLALHVVMDRLTPAERVAFVLHDIFDLPFGQIADVLGSGDLAGLLALLAPDAELHAVNPEGATVIKGAEQIAAQARAARAGAATGAVLRPVVVRGAAGVLILVRDRPVTVMAFTVQDGLVTEIRSVADPDRLAQIVPSWVV